MESVEEQRLDAKKAADTLRFREKELGEEIDNFQQKNKVLSGLVDVVTERAEAAQREVDKLNKEIARLHETRQSTGSEISNTTADADRSADAATKPATVGDSSKEVSVNIIT